MYAIFLVYALSFLCSVATSWNICLTSPYQECCLPLHLNFSSLRASIRRRCMRFGVSHLAPDVSIGLRCRYSASQRRLQSQMNGFRARCLEHGDHSEYWEQLNLLKPTGYVMHQQFNIQQLYALPTLYLCVLYLPENKQRLVPLTA